MWAHLSRWCQSAVNVKETQDVSVRREPVGFFHFSPSFFYLNSSSSPARSKEKHTGSELFACDPTYAFSPSVQSSWLRFARSSSWSRLNTPCGTCQVSYATLWLSPQPIRDEHRDRDVIKWACCLRSPAKWCIEDRNTADRKQSRVSAGKLVYLQLSEGCLLVCNKRL